MSDNRVQLGCGTLIIIAIIVALFSGRNDLEKVQRELEDVNRKLDRLEQKLDALSQGLGRQPATAPAPPAVR
jgi:Sec-independent protein translocase protein TatA